MNQLIEQLKRFKNYCYWSGAEAKAGERLWWQGYLDALEHVISLLKEAMKKNV